MRKFLRIIIAGAVGVTGRILWRRCVEQLTRSRDVLGAPSLAKRPWCRMRWKPSEIAVGAAAWASFIASPYAPECPDGLPDWPRFHRLAARARGNARFGAPMGDPTYTFRPDLYIDSSRPRAVAIAR
jgi:hypothetical protein